VGRASDNSGCDDSSGLVTTIWVALILAVAFALVFSFAWVTK
jgi:hypothetical protein